MKNQGFTLIELMAALTISAILLAIAVPAFDKLIRDLRIESAAWEFFDATQVTRSYAVKANRRVTMLANPTWGDGWQVFYDENHNGLMDDGEQLLLSHSELHESIQVNGNRPLQDYISYLGTGESRWASGKEEGAFQAGTITICPDDEGPGYALVLSRGGRFRKEALSQEECEALT